MPSRSRAAPRAFRFRPPAVAPSPGLAWVLAGAFAPPARPAARPGSARALELAAELGLLPRIAARADLRAVAAELGTAAAERLRRERALAAAAELRADEALAAAARVAAAIACPLAVLKGHALRIAGHAAPGARPSQDLDLLAPPGRLAELHRELLAAGFADAGGAGYEHQLPPLRHAGGEIVELHRHLPGVRLAGRESADWRALERAGLLVAAPATAHLALPVPEVLAAHALVHVLAQHGFTGRYPAWRLIGDLIDLGAEERADGRWRAWIARDVAATEIDAALRLARAVAAGVDPLSGSGAEEPAALARHFVAAALDPDYAESLKGRAWESPLSERGPLAARLRLVARAFVPPARRTAAGGPERGARRAASWLARPFALARSARAAWRAARRLERESTRIERRNDDDDA
jgi:hypothetical protein